MDILDKIQKQLNEKIETIPIENEVMKTVTQIVDNFRKDSDDELEFAKTFLVFSNRMIQYFTGMKKTAQNDIRKLSKK